MPRARTRRTTILSILVAIFFGVSDLGPVDAPSDAFATAAQLAPEGEYVPVAPNRVFGGELNHETDTTVGVLGTGVIPTTGVSAVLVDIAAAETSAVDNWLFLWPSDLARPAVSQFRFGKDNVPRSSTVVIPITAPGDLTLRLARGTARVNVDVQGYFTNSQQGAGFTPVTPTRLIDTKAGLGTGHATVPANGSVTFKLVGGVVPSGVEAVYANMEVFDKTSNGSIALAPGDGQVDTSTATMNYSTGSNDQSGMAMALSAQGWVRVHNKGPSDVAVRIDAQGYFQAGQGGGFNALSSHEELAVQRLEAGQSSVIDVAGRAGIPDYGASAAALSVFAEGYSQNGRVRVWPTGNSGPELPALVFNGSNEVGSVSNTVISQLGEEGRITITNTSGASVLVKVHLQGWFTATRAVPAAAETFFRAASAEAGYSNDLIERGLYDGWVYGEIAGGFLERASTQSGTSSETNFLDQVGLLAIVPEESTEDDELVVDSGIDNDDPEAVPPGDDPYAGEDDASARPVACNGIRGWYKVRWTKKSWPLGTVIYKWSHRTYYCRSGGKVRRLFKRADWVTNAQVIVDVQGVTGNWTSGVGTTKATSFRQRKIQLCAVKIACYATLYPTARLYVGGNGNHSNSGKAG